MPGEYAGSTEVHDTVYFSFGRRGWLLHYLRCSETHWMVPVHLCPSSPSQSLKKQKRVPRRCSCTNPSLTIHTWWWGDLGDVRIGLGFSSELEWVRTSAFAQMAWQEMEPDGQVLSFCCASHHAAQGEKSWMKYIGVQFWATQLGRKRPNFQIFFSIFRSLMAAEVSGATYTRKIYEDISWSIICGENCRKGRGNRCNTS